MEKRNLNNRAAQLPNFCHLGVTLRIALAAELLVAVGVVARVADLRDFIDEFVSLSAVAQPALLLTLLALCAASRWLARLPYRNGVVATLTIGTMLPVLTAATINPPNAAGPVVVGVVALFLGMALLAYFDLRGRALSPAIAEARLAALQARIRPHFLFNSINAVLSVLRGDPRRAERLLEDLAELFRALMSDARSLVPLADEIALTRAYLELEALRLGDRLRVTWHVGNMPGDALVPPLLIQPLVENAVYHGIEPSAAPGEISINVYRRGDHVHIVIRNPLADEARHRKGNGIALENIRERLLLFFDLDATFKLKPMGAVYQVHIALPYTRDRHRSALRSDR